MPVCPVAGEAAASSAAIRHGREGRDLDMMSPQLTWSTSRYRAVDLQLALFAPPPVPQRGRAPLHCRKIRWAKSWSDLRRRVDVEPSPRIRDLREEPSRPDVPVRHVFDRVGIHAGFRDLDGARHPPSIRQGAQQIDRCGLAAPLQRPAVVLRAEVATRMTVNEFPGNSRVREAPETVNISVLGETFVG
jgi:hypothetical protein